MSETRGRPFTAGNQCGRGRPKGSRNKSTLAVEALFSQHSESIVKKCMSEALKGSPMAMKLCIERILPPRRGVLVEFPLRSTATAAEVDAVSQKVVREVARGRMTPEDGETVSNILGARARIIETRDLEARIEKFEQEQSRLEGNRAA